MMAMDSFQLNEKELRSLAEMCAMSLDLLFAATPEGREKDARLWRDLCVRVLDAAHTVPAIAADMERYPDYGTWIFKRSYRENDFFEELIDEYRDSTFWGELVSRMAERALAESIGQEALEQLSDEERRSRTAAMEKALWRECSEHGIDRLVFMLPASES